VANVVPSGENPTLRKPPSSPFAKVRAFSGRAFRSQSSTVPVPRSTAARLPPSGENAKRKRLSIPSMEQKNRGELFCKFQIRILAFFTPAVPNQRPSGDTTKLAMAGASLWSVWRSFRSSRSQNSIRPSTRPRIIVAPAVAIHVVQRNPQQNWPELAFALPLWLGAGAAAWLGAASAQARADYDTRG